MCPDHRDSAGTGGHTNYLAVPVDLHVGAEVAAVVEVLAALWTCRGKLARPLVHTPVVLVVAQLAELFAALKTVERLLARVRAHVNLRQKQHIRQKRTTSDA